MADEHSEPGGMKVLRLYADALGESRFETTDNADGAQRARPPAAPLYVGKVGRQDLKRPVYF